MGDFEGNSSSKSSRYPCILLAAGASSRMGRQKLLLPLGNKPVVRFIAETILILTRPLVVVVGSNGQEVSRALRGLTGTIVVENPNWQDGMVGSAQVGIDTLRKNCPDVSGFFLHQADKPFVPVSVFAALAEYMDTMDTMDTTGTGKAKTVYEPDPDANPGSNRSLPCALVASYRGDSGHPVLFPLRYIPALLSLPAGERLKPVLDLLGSMQVECNTTTVLEDIDTLSDYESLTKKYAATFSGLE
ncbi:MAG TPA: nucleotidyltransferase family protein [Spirochaetales bacterium]|nr:nucleotidyltransferase family protein [Spirochaetales bacterium]